MRKIIITMLVILLCFSFIAADYTTPDERITELKERQDTANMMANCARTLGYGEEHEIIKTAKWEWHSAQDEITYLEEQSKNYTDDDVRILATVIYNEAWSGCSDRHREMVGMVVLNRVNSTQFPDDICSVVTQKGQYHSGYVIENGYYHNKATADIDAWDTCVEIATRCLNGEVECPSNVLFQSNYSSLGEYDEEYQSKYYEVHKTSYSTTYFAFGKKD